MTDNAMLAAALAYAAKGIPVFPCDGKVPAIPTGFHGASVEETQIRAWFENSSFNIAIKPADAGYVVVDLDLGVDRDVVDRMPPTRTVRTPSGGYHFYYRTDEAYGNSKPFPKVDIRGGSGYVLVPPSPGYVEMDVREPVPFPSWFADKLAKPAKSDYVVPGEGDAINHHKLIDILSRIDPGCSYHDWTRVIAACSTLTPDFDLYIPDVLLAWSAGTYHGNQEPDNYCGDAFDMAEKLASFKGEGCTIGTLLHMAGLLDHETDPMAPADYSAESWIDRKLAKSTQLIGPINSGSRVMLHAPTGLGKTHFAMALSASLAAGESFCHWGVPEAKKVLYIDGEMPQGLMQERIRDMARRVGDMGRRLWFVSHADLPGGWASLNTTEGQTQVQAWVDYLKPDLIVFDNIQALVMGDLKENTSWAGVQGWARGLGVAHIWVHHSNSSGTAYGDKSREWQMDTVIHLHPVEGADDTVLMFDLQFPKHRESTPQNRGDYVKGRFTLDREWVFTSETDLPDFDLEQAIDELGGEATVAELADYFGIDKKTVTKRSRPGGSNGVKWARYRFMGAREGVKGQLLMFKIPS